MVVLNILTRALPVCDCVEYLNYNNGLCLKRHRDVKVSSSGEIKHRIFETSLLKKVEEEITNHMKIMNNMSKLFLRPTSDEVRNFVFDVAEEK